VDTGFGKKSCANEIPHDPEKWVPVFGKDHAQMKWWLLAQLHPVVL
jgi:hypothetical protein